MEVTIVNNQTFFTQFNLWISVCCIFVSGGVPVLRKFGRCFSSNPSLLLVHEILDLFCMCVCVCTSPWPDHKLESRSPASTLPIRARLISWCLGTAPILLAHGGTVTTPSQQKKPGLSGARTSACHTLKLAAQCLKQLSYRSGVTVTHFKLSTNSSKLQKLQDSQSSNSF